MTTTLTTSLTTTVGTDADAEGTPIVVTVVYENDSTGEVLKPQVMTFQERDLDAALECVRRLALLHLAEAEAGDDVGDGDGV